MTISEKEWRWVKRMQKAGLFPPDLPEPEPPPPKGLWRMTSQPDGSVFVELNDVPVPTEIGLEIARLMVKPWGDA